MHWQRWFLEAQLGIGRDSSSLPQSSGVHVLVAPSLGSLAVQIIPVVSVHAALPQIRQCVMLAAGGQDAGQQPPASGQDKN